MRRFDEPGGEGLSPKLLRLEACLRPALMTRHSALPLLGLFDSLPGGGPRENPCASLRPAQTAETRGAKGTCLTSWRICKTMSSRRRLLNSKPEGRDEEPHSGGGRLAAWRSPHY